MDDTNPPPDSVTVTGAGVPVSSLTVQVGTREIYDTLLRLEGRMVSLTESVNGIHGTLRDHDKRLRHTDRQVTEVTKTVTGIEQQVSDHETRHRVSERRLSRLIYGLPLTAIAGVLSVLGAMWHK